MKLIRAGLILGGLLLVLGAVNLDILRKEDTIANGRLVLLELRPVDPRSLIQGDYMLLRYGSAAFPPAESIPSLPPRGTLILKLDETGIARFERLDDGATLAAAEVRLDYKSRMRDGELRLGAESYLFQEGDAGVFATARFAMLRVDDDGNSVLVGLAGEDRRRLDRPPGMD
jgi:uncharacterized membrane-anchored protein